MIFWFAACCVIAVVLGAVIDQVNGRRRVRKVTEPFRAAFEKKEDEP
jgi:hypothetical protein